MTNIFTFCTATAGMGFDILPVVDIGLGVVHSRLVAAAGSIHQVEVTLMDAMDKPTVQSTATAVGQCLHLVVDELGWPIVGTTGLGYSKLEHT